MLFKNEEESLRLEIVSYELPEDAEDRNWLVLRASYTGEDGQVVKDTNACLLAEELEAMTAGLKVLNAGLRDQYVSEFTLPDFTLSLLAREETFPFCVTFAFPNSMELVDGAEVRGVMGKEELKALVGELDKLTGRFPKRA